jgi:glycosyltransferase involved in cell wall biosynthesis
VDTITLVICTYNNAPLVEQALTNIEQQRNAPAGWSVMVVDNNSTDDTAEVVDRFVQRGSIPGLRRILETTQGVAFARRRAIIEADSEWIAFMDDDCLLRDDWMAEALRACKAHPNAGAMGGRVQLQWEVPPDDYVARHASGYAEQDYGSKACLLPTDGHLVGPGMLVRKQAVLDCKWLDYMALVSRQGRHLTTGEDTELVFRIRNAGYELRYDPALVVTHCIPARRMCVDYLCRLYRGAGQSRPFTKCMKVNRAPTLACRLDVFFKHLRLFSRVCRTVLFDYVLSRRAMDPDFKIALSFRIGQMEGAWAFLRQGYRT